MTLEGTLYTLANVPGRTSASKLSESLNFFLQMKAISADVLCGRMSPDPVSLCAVGTVYRSRERTAA